MKNFIITLLFISLSAMGMRNQNAFNQKMIELLVSINSENDQMFYLIANTYSNLFACGHYYQDKINVLKKMRDNCTIYSEKQKIIEQLTNSEWSLEMLFKNKLYERLNEEKKPGEERGEEEALELLKYTIERYKKDLRALKKYLAENYQIELNIKSELILEDALLIRELKKKLKNRNNRLHQYALEQLCMNYYNANDLFSFNFFNKQLKDPLRLRCLSTTINDFYSKNLNEKKIVLDESKIQRKLLLRKNKTKKVN